MDAALNVTQATDRLLQQNRHKAEVFGTAANSVCFLRSFCRADEATGMPLHDPGRVKTLKGRSRRGIMFYPRRGFRVVLSMVAGTLRWKERSF